MKNKTNSKTKSNQAHFGHTPAGCPCALSQAELDQLQDLLRRGKQHGQIHIGVYTGTNSRLGFATTKIPSVTRLNGGIEITLSTEGVGDILAYFWNGVIGQKSCSVELKPS